MKVALPFVLVVAIIHQAAGWRKTWKTSDLEVGKGDSNHDDSAQVTHCSTFRRWADIELARDLHKASTSVLHDFVSRLKRYEEARSRRQDEEVHSTRDLQAALTSLLAKLQSSIFNFDEIQQDRKLRLATVQTDLETVSSNLQNLPDVLKVALSEISQSHESNLVDVLKSQEAELDFSLAKHQDHLHSALERFNTELKLALKDLNSGVASVSNEFAVFIETTESAKDVITDAKQVTCILSNSHLRLEIAYILDNGQTAIELHRTSKSTMSLLSSSLQQITQKQVCQSYLTLDETNR
ncbi:hypothetical protein JCM5350_005479 [Sporobolomyces pararoseus]